MFSPCILLIDPDVKLLARLETLLSRAGYRVLTAHDGSQGLYLAQAALPEVIVCAVTIPAPNDFDIKSTLAQDSRTASIPFIFLTKPFDKQELVASVNEVIRGRERNSRRLTKPVTS
jgi:DNA-binding response OmpR family regulator